MSEELLKSVQDMLNEEQWTRAAISNYSKNNFLELAAIVEEAKKQNCIDEIKAACDEHLAHSKNSIIALYISGMLSLKKKDLDESALTTLVNIFVDNHKTNIVTYLCDAILKEDENNKFALRKLAECYKEDNNERIWEIYTSIVKLDREEAEIAKLLAEKYENDGDIETAVEYYKKALLRFVNKNLGNQIKEIWTKLVSLVPEEIYFFNLVQKEVAKSISKDKAALLLHELYNYYHDNQKWDTAIDILKTILSYDDKDPWARKEIIECYRGKYEGHSQLENYIKVSNLSQHWRNVFEAISDFEKHISFDAHNFVFHRSWGVGIISKVDSDEITINFGKTYGVKKMTLKMAVSALQPLAKDHIWVLKATKKKEELAKEVKENKSKVLKIIIKSFNNKCDIKRIKAELVPSILSASEWTSWSTQARKILEEDPTFGVDSNDISLYTVRDHAITQEEKLENEFKAQKNFFSRIDILMKFANDDETDKTSEQFAEMFEYFVGYLKSFNQVNEQIIASYLVARRISTANPHLNPNLQFSFADLFKEIEDPRKIYEELKDTKNTSLKKDYLNCIKELLPDWPDIYIKLFPTVLSQEILDALIINGNKEKVTKFVQTCFENYRDYREAVIFFFKESQDEDWFKEAEIPYEKQLITLIHILDLTYREIENHRDTTENRKINKNIQQLLFKNNTLLDYMLSNDIDTVTRLYTLVDDVKDLDPTIKQNMRNKILNVYKDFKFYGVEEKVTARKGIYTTMKMLEKNRALLDDLIKVQLPANAKEIDEAREKGDLKENAEYKAARDKQRILNAQISRLQADLDKAIVFDPTTITTARVSFGTTVCLLNKDTKEKEKYTILGPFESDPDNGIISYLSPLGEKILNAKDGEELNIEVNEQNYHYVVESIEAAEF
ncbi:MAG: transcription elongation factor GreA [Spirochaetaceae bacterium]|nr:transcription elongation factor GreA [Spirochaetaceae bacterium]